jgi:hypothetical protein
MFANEADAMAAAIKVRTIAGRRVLLIFRGYLQRGITKRGKEGIDITVVYMNINSNDRGASKLSTHRSNARREPVTEVFTPTLHIPFWSKYE